jgi:hypothetical protein
MAWPKKLTKAVKTDSQVWRSPGLYLNRRLPTYKENLLLPSHPRHLIWSANVMAQLGVARISCQIITDIVTFRHVQIRKCSTYPSLIQHSIGRIEWLLHGHDFRRRGRCRSVAYGRNLCGTDMGRLMTGKRSEKCVVRPFRRCANVIECTYTNLDSTV